MQNKEINEVRKFGIGLGLIILVLSGVAVYRLQGRAGTLPMLPHLLAAIVVAGVLVLLAGLLAPALIAPLYRFWMPIAAKLGAFNTQVLLFLTYFIALAPIAILRRLLGKDDLRWRYVERKSYFIEKKEEPITLERCRHQF